MGMDLLLLLPDKVLLLLLDKAQAPLRRWNIPDDAAAAEAGWGTCSGTAAGSGRRTAAALRRAPSLAQTEAAWAALMARWDTAAALTF